MKTTRIICSALLLLAASTSFAVRETGGDEPLGQSYLCVDKTVMDGAFGTLFKGIGKKNATVELSIPTGESSAVSYQGNCTKTEGADELHYNCTVAAGKQNYLVTLASMGSPELFASVRTEAEGGAWGGTILPCEPWE